MPPTKKVSKPSLLVPPENCLLPPCDPVKCRQNSRRNPNCFCQLGEKFWFSPIKDTFWTNIKDPETERKSESGYVGLKNLGATCYVNTFLQLWFHNKTFRAAIYQWTGGNVEPLEIINEDGDMNRSITLDFGERSTDAIGGSLQYLFSLLQFSERRYVDPLKFVISLGLQTDEQQDAQEFSKLFISLLQDSLSSTKNEHLSNVIQNQFGGSYKYQTKCNICGNISETRSKFYELDLNIKGHHKLIECMKEFLKEEILEGENKYFCPRCQSKQNATRRIILENLPPVLNIQLLRFVFDRQTGTKKKLNTSINFPNKIDMNEYMHFENKEDGIYHLNAVLIHCGLSAHSGHYIAHILDKEKDEWCRYNDECVTVMKGKSLNLGKEDDPEVVDEEKTKKAKKGDGHNSKNAYMLVYSRGMSDSITCKIPENMINIVSKDNSLFEEWVSFHKVIRNHAIEEGKEKQIFIQRIYPSLAVKNNDGECEWISTGWLRQWLNHDVVSIPPIDNSSLMCSHSFADPLKISLMKRVSKSVADELFSKYGGETHLPGDSLCQTCLENNRKKEAFELKLQEDVKLFNKAIKDSDNGFWVSKKSLKRFKQLAKDRYDLSQQQNDIVKDDNSDDASDMCMEVVNNDDDSFTFQQDIVCEHGNLSLNENIRKIISQEIWDMCLQYFPDVMSFPHDTKTCELCERKIQNSLEEKKTMMFLAQEQKQALSFLYDDSVQRMNNILCGGADSFQVVLSSFISSWKKVIKLNGNTEGLIVDNSDIICEHDLLLYTAEELIDECMGDSPEVFLVTENEYNTLKNFYPVNGDISLSTIMMHDEGNNRHFGVKPDYCPTCRNNRLMADAEESRHFSAAPIFVSKGVKKDIDISSDPPDQKTAKVWNEYSISQEEVSKYYKGGKVDKEDSKSYSISAKRLNLTGEMRRSNRKRIKRGEYMLQVNSHQSLKDLKIQVLGLYSVLPIEQTLLLGGKVLEGDDSYLVDLGISPGCHIMLMVDEPNKRLLNSDDSCDSFEKFTGDDDYEVGGKQLDKPRVLEAGFKGTNLLCGSQS